MKRLSFSFLAIAILSFIIVHSCSSEEDDTIAPNEVQTPEPEPPAPTQYSLTVTSVEGGTVSTEGGLYDEGTEVTITATPSEGYRFTGWEGNDSTSESLTITLNSNQTFQALFELILPFQFEYNLHSSLDDFAFYKDSISSVFLRLSEMMPIETYYDGNNEINGVAVYSWLAGGSKPYLSIIGDTDQCICGVINNKLVMSLQLQEGDFNEGANFKYALLAHEFFHVYQIYLSKGFDQGVFWLIEGQAATVESLYLKEFINDSGYIMNFLNKNYTSFDEGIQNVESYESYNGFNSVIGQYGDITIFMNLSLAKILQEQGNSEKESFKIIFEDYWKTDPNDSNWKIKFEEVFGISTSDFYQRLNEFKTNPENLVPEISLSEIFEKE